MMKTPKKLNKSQNGFTIVEILIATAILSTILVLVTIMITKIGGLYQKGISQARVQGAVRSISDDVSYNLQQSTGGWKGDGDTNNGAFCVGNIRYSYIIGKQIGTGAGQSRHVLWKDNIGLATDCHQVDLTAAAPNNSTQPGTNGTELVPPNSRLIKFDINDVSPYTFSVIVAYGDDDLLCSPSDAQTCSDDKAMILTGPGAYNDFLNRDIKCKGGTGGQFCATANSDTTIVKRLQG